MDPIATQWRGRELPIDLGGGKELGIKLSTRPRSPLRLGALAVLSVGPLVSVGRAQAAVAVRPVAWGCERIFPDAGWCNVPGGLYGANAISAGAFHSLALKSDGTVVVWGCASGDYGQCSVPGGLSGVTAIAAASYHSLASKSDGTVVAWGCGFPTDSGQCSVPVGLSGVTAIAAGGSHSLALKSDGTVVAWGCGPIQTGSACAVPGGLSGVTAIAAGLTHSVALKGDGTVVAWGCGSGGYGQCSVPSTLSGVAAVSASQYHTLALRSDGTVVAWGCGPRVPRLRAVQRAGRPFRCDRDRRRSSPQPRPQGGRHRDCLGLRHSRHRPVQRPDRPLPRHRDCSQLRAEPGDRAALPDDRLWTAREQGLRQPGLHRQRDSGVGVAGLLRRKRKLHDQRCDGASDGCRFVHGDRFAAG